MRRRGLIINIVSVKVTESNSICAVLECNTPFVLKCNGNKHIGETRLVVMKDTANQILDVIKEIAEQYGEWSSKHNELRDTAEALLGRYSVTPPIRDEVIVIKQTKKASDNSTIHFTPKWEVDEEE